jgi:serine/threonine protein kinase
MFSDDDLTAKVDIWAFAIVFVEMGTGQVPWVGKTPMQIMKLLDSQQKPTIPDNLSTEIRAMLAACFEHDPVSRPAAAQLIQLLEPMVSASSDEKTLLSMHANALLQGSWAKRDAYTFARLVDVVDVTDPGQKERYDEYKAQLGAEIGSGDHTTPEWENTFCQLLFHGCSEEALPLIAKEGFRTDKQTSAAGAWQRFGPGFYFALQASKSHEYPIGPMRALGPGTHTRSMQHSSI